VKIAVIGGAGVRTPLLANGLAHSDLPIDEIGLFDIDRDRLAIIGSVAAAFAPCVRSYTDAAECVSGASFVILSIREGGIAARARDEVTALAHGVVGQETVGAAGFAMAVRNIPSALQYAELIAREAPLAWIINFTNPVGIVTQAITTATTARVIGICDTPTELFEAVALALDIESSSCRFDYFGLNHLGWLREVYVDDAPQLRYVWPDATRLERIYRAPLFEPAFLKTLRLLPTEYLFYYYRPADAIGNTRSAARTRGQAIAVLNEELFRNLAAPGADCRLVYEHYLQARSAGYMQIESGGGASAAVPAWAELTGYDKIALQVIRAIHCDSHASLPLNVVNNGSLSDLHDDDVVEVPCTVNAAGAQPTGAPPCVVK
jgi:6-phospho-beta-glucosidase